MLPISDSEKSKRFPFINILLIAINIAVFYLQIINPETFTLMYALIPAKIDFSDINTLYPFITSMFLHGGLLHIGSNMLFLWVFGDNVEGNMPPFVYLFLYLTSGIVGSLVQYLLNPASDIPMLGASGAVAGALGAYFAYFPHHQIKTLVFIPPFITTANISAAVMLGYWIFLQVLSGVGTLGMTPEQGGVAYFAHIGGFATGYFFAKLSPTRDPQLERI
ncbi:MAG: rhomboid family intramembrane serine protease [Patescibacteria group bacterium]|nr:MAG: rhomboid family intramembrane serine protease [Patescibacteria group bacterium]